MASGRRATALVIIDMIVDFTTGRLGSPAARRIIPAVRRVLAAARRAAMPVIYVQDAHTPRDPELSVWGRHAMRGTRGAATHPALRPARGEPVVRKRTLSGFFRTSLERVLRRRGVRTVVLAGVATEYCVQHVAAEAHFRGLQVVVLRDGVAGLTAAAHRYALRYMQKAYGARVSTAAQFSRGLAA